MKQNGEKMKKMLTRDGRVPVFKIINPFGSFVRNLNDMMPCFETSHGGKIWRKNKLWKNINWEICT
jgi:hypothetical protein